MLASKAGSSVQGAQLQVFVKPAVPERLLAGEQSCPPKDSRLESPVWCLSMRSRTCQRRSAGGGSRRTHTSTCAPPEHEQSAPLPRNCLQTEEKGRLNAHKQGLINKVAELQEARSRPDPQVQPPRPALRSTVQVADDTKEPAQQEEAAPAQDGAPPGLEPMAEGVWVSRPVRDWGSALHGLGGA